MLGGWAWAGAPFEAVMDGHGLGINRDVFGAMCVGLVAAHGEAYPTVNRATEDGPAQVNFSLIYIVRAKVLHKGGAWPPRGARIGCCVSCSKLAPEPAGYLVRSSWGVQHFGCKTTVSPCIVFWGVATLLEWGWGWGNVVGASARQRNNDFGPCRTP